MSKANAISSMQQSIKKYIQANIPKEKNQAELGIVRGDSVLIGNRKYFSDCVNDMWLNDGDEVYCLKPTSGNQAAIVGKKI